MGLITFKGTLLILFGLLAIIIPMAPISSTPLFFEIPDIVICIIFSWLLNDPKNTPVSSILFLSLMADIMWQRPLGLWPMFILIASELVRYYRLKITNQGIVTKLFYFTIFLIFINCGVKFLSLVGILRPLDFSIWLNHFLLTILSFSIVNVILENTIFKHEKKPN